jgi:exosortase/archaeosortase family protein
MRPFFPDVRAEGAQLSAGGFAVTIEDICTGLDALTVVVAAVLAYPAPLLARRAGLVFAAGSIQAINLLRVVSLVYIGGHHPALFEQAHFVVWQALVIAWGVATLVVWIQCLAWWNGARAQVPS